VIRKRRHSPRTNAEPGENIRTIILRWKERKGGRKENRVYHNREGKEEGVFHMILVYKKKRGGVSFLFRKQATIRRKWGAKILFVLLSMGGVVGGRGGGGRKKREAVNLLITRSSGGYRSPDYSL